MYWPKFSLAALTRKICGETPQGVSCSYVQWTKNVGLKLFTCKYTRDHSYKGQKRAAEHKLAPKVGKKLQFKALSFGGDDYNAPNPTPITIYGFFTETARIGGRRPPSDRAVMRLSEKLDDIGINHFDLHECNVGKIGNRVVCIDFDTASCSLQGE